jgi:D-xylose transport system substrate-binding protein
MEAATSNSVAARQLKAKAGAGRSLLILPGLAVVALVVIAIVVFIVINNNPSPSLTGYEAAKGCKNVAVLLPEADPAARWEAHDRALLDTALKQALPSVTIQYANANNDAATQQRQAEDALAKGACIMIVSAKDSEQAAAIVQKAKASQVPVIAYDRLIQDKDLAFYVSFDNVRVGELQGQYIVDNHKKGDRVVMIHGSQSDNNAILFRQGALNKLQPLFDSGELVKVYDQYTPNWNNAAAQSEMEEALSQNQNNIQIAYVANDGMANGVITALRAQNLNGQVLVTGQDADRVGIQNILLGDQAMLVYKAIPKEAAAVATLTAALSNGTLPAGLINGKSKTKDGAEILSILATPVTVTKENIADTIIADNFMSKSDICNGLPPGVGAEICS